MLLHEIKPNHPRKYKKPRVGRGGKRGTSSGKGTKGQKSRAGRKIRPAERDYIQRLPKLRGHKNKPVSRKLRAINVGDLEKLVGGNVVDVKVLPGVKILGGGELKKTYEIKGVPVSESARKKIEAVGGVITNNPHYSDE